MPYVIRPQHKVKQVSHLLHLSVRYIPKLSKKRKHKTQIYVSVSVQIRTDKSWKNLKLNLTILAQSLIRTVLAQFQIKTDSLGANSI